MKGSDFVNSKSVKTSTILLGILLVIAGFFMIAEPVESFLDMTLIIGICAIIKGIMLVVMYFRAKEHHQAIAVSSLLLGIVLVILGVIFIIKPIVFAAVVTYIISLWFMFTGIMGISSAKMYKDSKFYYVFNIILDILLIIGAVLILFNVLSAVFAASILLGTLFIIDGISSIVWACSIKTE